jgi:hypothetical protein
MYAMPDLLSKGIECKGIEDIIGIKHIVDS